MTDIVKRIRSAVLGAEDRAGTMPAAKAVKLLPSDWHTVSGLAREASEIITALRASNASLREELAEAYEDLIEHHGDSMDDTRANRVAALRSIEEAHP